MQYANTQKIKEHMEWLGYWVSDDTDLESGHDSLYARHVSNYDVKILNNEAGVIYLTFVFVPFDNEKSASIDFFHMLNSINFDSTFTKWSSSVVKKFEHTAIAINAYMMGYEKQHFAQWINSVNKEVSSYLPNVKNYWKSNN